MGVEHTAMTTGIMDFMTAPGFMTPRLATPTPDLAVPYAAPISATNCGQAQASPPKPKPKPSRPKTRNCSGTEQGKSLGG